MNKKTFKDFLKSDLDVFFNTNELSEIHNIDGFDINCVISYDTFKTLNRNRSYDQYDGVFSEEFVLFAKSNDFEERPVVGQNIKLDGKLYYVIACNNEYGMLKITLGANES